MAWAPNYAQVADLAEYLRIPDAQDDQTLAASIAAASRAIDEATGRQFGQVASPEVRYYEPRFDRVRCSWVAQVDDLMTTTGLAVVQDGATVTEYTLGPRNALAKGLPYTEVWVEDASTEELAITARWGWSAVPDAVKTACLLQAGRLFKRRDAPFGVAGSPQLGSEMRLLAKLDPDVEVTLRAYRRWWGAV